MRGNDGKFAPAGRPEAEVSLASAQSRLTEAALIDGDDGFSDEDDCDHYYLDDDGRCDECGEYPD